MEIDSRNVSDFIRFLYRTRLNQEAGEDVVHSWEGLSEEDTKNYLNQLFASWNYDTEQVQTVYQDYFKSLKTTTHPVPPKPPVDFPENPVADYNYEPLPAAHRRPGRVLLWLLLLVFVMGGGFLIYKYQQFRSIHYLYVVTDNVLIRNSEGKTIGRMDIYAKDKPNSFSYLKTPDSKIYPMTIDGKVYPYRRVLFDSTGFWDYLRNDPATFGYVNENYVIEDKDNFILYRKVFRSLDQNKAESSNLSSTFRNVIIGSLKSAPELDELYITAPCKADGRTQSNLVKYQNAQGTVQVIAQLSNGNYYLFTGNPETGKYEAPRLFQYQNANSGVMNSFSQENILFKKVNGSYFLYDCNGTEMDYFVHVNQDGIMDYAQSSFQAQ